MALGVIAFAYVVIPVAGDLLAARASLSGSVADLGPDTVEEAKARLEHAHARLNSVPGKILRLVPVLGSNLSAIDAVAVDAGPVLDAGLALQASVEDLEEEGLMSNDRVRFDALEAMEPLLDRQLETLAAFEETLASHRSGLLLPPIWDAIDEAARRLAQVTDDASAFRDALDIARPMLGSEGERTYLIVSLNNAELRGAGGLLSAVGTLTVDDGRINLGPQYAREQLTDYPPKSVPAPDEYVRRFGVYKANTTIWANVSYSPHVPDVALVAARLFERVQGIETDGAIVIDPIALAALMPPDAAIDVPDSDEVLERDDVAAFIFSDAYQAFDRQKQRRAAIVEVGKRAFEAFVETGFQGDIRGDVGDAVAGGHLRFVSFRPDEAKVLARLGVSGALEEPSGDALIVTTQNWGDGAGEGTKLDYWVERHVGHGCDIADDGSARCETKVTLTNTAPEGLTRYVAGAPYGRLRAFTEMYVPVAAELEKVSVDGAPVSFHAEGQAGYTALGRYLEVDPGQSVTYAAVYELPSEDGSYSLTAIPQPLAHDATIEIALALPDDWAVTGPAEVRDGQLHFEGEFDSTVEVRATPEARSGIPALWDAVTDFWRNPIF